MLALRHVLSAPVLVLGAAVTGFAVWVASDTLAPASLAVPTRADTDEPPGAPHVAVLGGLHPGIPRAYVERRLVALPPPMHEPVDLSADTPICRVQYHIYLGHPVPQLEERLHEGFVPGPYLLVLEFDGGTEGQPLIRAVITRSR